MKSEKYNMKKYWNNRAKIYGKAAVGRLTSKVYKSFFTKFQEKAFSDTLKIVNNEKKVVLDVGCGVGRLFKFFPNVHIVGMDISSEMIRHAKNLASDSLRDLILASATHLPFRNSCFDLAYSVTVLQHVPYDKQLFAVREICRVTKTESEVFIIALELTDIKDIAFHVFPNTEGGWMKMFNKCGHELRKCVPFDYAFPLRSFDAFYSFIASKLRGRIATSREAKTRKQSANLGNKRFHFYKKRLKTLFMVVSKLMVLISYPLEWICYKTHLSYGARHHAFLFQRRKI